MQFDPAIFESSVEIFAPTNFNACLNAHGLYSPERFVLRLSPRNHELMAITRDSKGIRRRDLDDETLQAISTYLHETVHWWQHKGSTSGFIRSALYLAKIHDNLHHLIELTALVGFKKPLHRWWHIKQQEGSLAGTRAEELANVIVNNFFDSMFYMGITLDPELARKFAKSTYFECVGHCYWMAYEQVLNDLRMNVDDDRRVLPDNAAWESAFLQLRKREVVGHYYGSPIGLAPLGLQHILEGQARFIQLQFLAFANGGLSLRKAHEEGFLSELYGKAFKLFLKHSKSEEPEEIDSPLVALFLLICDLAINPTSGFPFEIADFENFHLDNDPGYRFMILCNAVAVELPHLRSAIQNYSREDYISVATALCETCGYENPMLAFEVVAKWEECQPKIAALMEEHRTFKFGPPNITTRVLLAEFIAFAKDKLHRPDYFCWAGAYMAGPRSGNDVRALWETHLALYSDGPEDKTIIARQVHGRQTSDVNTAFQNFYVGLMTCDMMVQWILCDGPFDLSFDWLADSQKSGGLKAFAEELFQKQYKMKPGEFDIIP